MITGTAKPSLFIGSSAEGLDVAYAMQEHLEYIAEPTVWSQGVFKPSSFTLIDLVKATSKFQIAVFVFSFDDVLTIRNSSMQAVRDNIVFEFGLFIGAIGLQRCFFVMPRASQPLHLPTDLLGLEPLTYQADRSDSSLVAALGPVANRLRRAIRELAVSQENSGFERADARPATQLATETDYIAIWNSDSILQARAAVQMMPSSPYGYDDEEMSAHRALRRLFTFFESLADAVLAGEIDEGAMREAFLKPLTVLWPHMYVLLAPANHAEDWWRPLPKTAELYNRWGGGRQ